jgi:Beta-propeller repeat
MYQYTLVNNVVTPLTICNANWQSLGANRFKINNATPYNPALPLIIKISQGTATQPNINNLNWSTYFGGGLADYIYKSKSDASNNLYVAGKTISTNFPPGINAGLFPQLSAGYDGFFSQV